MWPFRRSGGNSYALVHIGPRSVTSGLIWHPAGGKPTICATARTTIAQRDGEEPEAALARALAEAGDAMVRIGAPALRRLAGSGRVSRAYVALQCPWESGSVETKKLTPDSPFTYTRAMELEALGKDDGIAADAGGRASYRHVAGTLLNGYLTHEPYGKRARNAELFIFRSELTRAAGEAVTSAMRRAFHAHHDTQIAFSFAATVALQMLHPELKDFLVLSIPPETVEVVSVKRGHIVDAATGALGTDALIGKSAAPASADTGAEPATERQPGYVAPAPKPGSAAAAAAARREWVAALATLLKGCATRHALPRTLFIIADPEAHAALTDALADESLHALWLSDAPVTMVALTPKHLASAIGVTGDAEADVPLALLALFAANRRG